MDEAAVVEARERVVDPRALHRRRRTRAPGGDGLARRGRVPETIEHVDDPAGLVAEARRVLRPGGRLVCSTPNRAVTNPGAGPEARPLNPFHLPEYASDDLEVLLAPHFERLEWYGQAALAPTRGGC